MGHLKVCTIAVLLASTILQASGQGRSGPVKQFDAYPMGSDALYLVWQKPEEPNGILTGYNIYYAAFHETYIGPLLQRGSGIRDPDATAAKLTGLHPRTTYRVQIRPVTRNGEGQYLFLEKTTGGPASVRPGVPNFTWKRIEIPIDMGAIKVTWLPNLNGNLGRDFFVKYKLRGETIEQRTESENYENSIQIYGLKKGGVYDVSIVAVDGEFSTESQPQEVDLNRES